MNRIKLIGTGFLAALLLSGPASASDMVLADNEPGTFLVFARFDIRGNRTTTIRIENVGDRDLSAAGQGNVKLNVICPGIPQVDDFCAAQDQVVEITPKGTAVIDIDDLNPPCNEGFVVAFPQADLTPAVPPTQLVPISYNSLTGSYRIQRGNRLEAENAIHVQSTRADGAQVGTPVAGGITEFQFGPDPVLANQDFKAMPTVSYTGFRATNGNVGTSLIVLTLDTNAGQGNPIATVGLDWWSEDETPFSSSHRFICWDRVDLDDIDDNFLEAELGSEYGLLELQTVPTCPIAGACPPFIPFDATLLGAVQEFGGGFSSARTLLHDNVGKSTRFQPE